MAKWDRTTLSISPNHFMTKYTSDGSSLYCAGEQTTTPFPFHLFKVDPLAMALASSPNTWTLSRVVQSLAVHYLDGYVYVSTFESPAKVYKIDRATMAAVGTEWTDASARGNAICLTTDGTYLYLLLAANPGLLVKIDPSTMSTVATWTGDTGDLTIAGSQLAYNDGCVYVPIFISPGKAHKVDTATMTTSATWTGESSSGQDKASVLLHDGTSLYVGCYNTAASGHLVKVDPDGMSTLSEWIAPSDAYHGGAAASVFGGNGKIYFANDSKDPGAIDEIDPATMESTDSVCPLVGVYSYHNPAIYDSDGYFIWSTNDETTLIDRFTIRELAAGDNIAWGERNPIGQVRESWSDWAISEGVPATVIGDPDWGQLQVTSGVPVFGPVIDQGDTNSKTATLARDTYGTGSGNVTLALREASSLSDRIYDKDDASWVDASTAIIETWQYWQCKMEYTA